ncbi:MAG TPA: PKD domain-containing protein [Vicinamibacterales bacterium]|jgi:PKD repeat protein
MAKQHFLLTAAVAAAVFAAGCTTHQTEIPALTGPSGLGNNITITVSPDVLAEDGASQSLVTITARNSTGQALPNESMRVNLEVNGAAAQFGSLSAANVVTNGNGQATLVYTAPPPPAGSVPSTSVQVVVTPSATDFNDVTPASATIRVVPQGVVVPPSNGTASFLVNPASPGQGDKVTFTAKVLDASGKDITSQVSSFAWNFGDGGTGSGQNVTHTFNTQGTFQVSLTATALGQSFSSSQSPVTVGGPSTFSPSFFTNPASNLVSGENITFNASANTPPAGHTITAYIWDFGDGSDVATGVVVTHTFASAATYNVLLRVTLDNGSQPTSQTALTINPPNPTAQMSIVPPTARPGDLIEFLGNTSTPAPGHQITSYVWTFGDGTSATGSTVTHSYAITNGQPSQTFTVTLIVTDEDGNQNIALGTVTITTSD